MNAKLLTFQDYSLKEKRVNACPFDAWILNLDLLLNSELISHRYRKRLKNSTMSRVSRGTFEVKYMKV